MPAALASVQKLSRTTRSEVTCVGVPCYSLIQKHVLSVLNERDECLCEKQPHFSIWIIQRESLDHVSLSERHTCHVCTTGF